MGFETKWADAAICPTRDRRAPKSHRHRSWIERLLSSAFRTVVEGFALYGAALYPGPFLSANDQPRFPGFGEVRRNGSRAAWEGIDNQTLKDVGIPDENDSRAEKTPAAAQTTRTCAVELPSSSNCSHQLPRIRKRFQSPDCRQ
jgi:hypothetical protein